MDQQMDKDEVDMTSITKEAGSETLENDKTGNALDETTFSSVVSIEGIESEDSAASSEEGEQYGRSVRWPAKLLEGEADGTWVGISSPFPLPQHPITDPFVQINPRILSSTSGSGAPPPSHHLPQSDLISTQPDLSTSAAVSDLQSLTAFKTPPFPLPAFPSRLPLSAPNQVTSLFSFSLERAVSFTRHGHGGRATPLIGQ